MAVARKGKRKLVRNEREFYWFMKLTDDWMCAYNEPQLHVVSDDKKFLISYQPGQENENPFLIVKGKEFTGINDAGGTWIRVKVPHWDDERITPGFVRQLIDWCLGDKEDILFVDYIGRPISTSERSTKIDE